MEKQRLALATTLLTTIWLVGCEDVPTGAEPLSPLFTIDDAAHGGSNEHFYFLPPLVPDPSPSGVFDGSLAVEVEICDVSLCGTSSLAVYTMAGGPGSETVRAVLSDEHYIVNWHASDFDLDPDRTYRVIVRADASELGFADVDVASSGNDLKNVNTGEYIALKDGRTLPIKFRIEEGAVPPPVDEPTISPTFGGTGIRVVVIDPECRMAGAQLMVFFEQAGGSPDVGRPADHFSVSADGCSATGDVPGSLNITPHFVTVHLNVQTDPPILNVLAFDVTV